MYAALPCAVFARLTPESLVQKCRQFFLAASPKPDQFFLTFTEKISAFFGDWAPPLLSVSESLKMALVCGIFRQLIRYKKTFKTDEKLNI